MIFRPLGGREYGCELRCREGGACAGWGKLMRVDGNLVGDLGRGGIGRDRTRLGSWELSWMR